ncbi:MULTISPECIES: U32 family peptidase [unclassified Paenibacillus]|uniref:U32 family peptidase n=1 Tax=unclassified Paenibacillus TaxID=185978 RepID=UPI002474768D|nr:MULTISPECIES: U32 family peptidase [unclassified Paenibacillus]MDH6428632.1 putative protease [Paenibacillus sp. PastH-4]MDH6444833.1 putative protease [Paenibacillus sp. PastF-4]MDH6528727.1 putative protease [Paenibacillus sp. PastH-3]
MKEQQIRREDVELLAPAGDWDCMRAAVANGADAIFFGVEKFNARARANNFRMDELSEIMAFLHSYGVKGFLTFNILVFENELSDAKELIDACVDAGVDAVIVQDLGLVKMIREISPDFPIHGSTQMTITSPEAVEFTKPFSLERVVLGRENNLKQIRTIGEQARLPMEVFVHGALCVSYSGQCLTSEMWGGRSANRGECAQACRLPYDLMVDGEVKPMGDVTYLLSPKDLAAIDLMPELIEAGVTSFKIEGRLKSPEYVANVVSKYRKAIDRYFEGDLSKPSKEEVRELQQSFSRGFTHGFLDGTNNKKLVDGTFPKSRGVYLGTVEQILRDGVVCRIHAPLKRGDGIVFDAGDPTKKEEGGRVYDLRRKGVKLEGEAGEGWIIDIVAGRNDVDLRRLNVGDRIWKTNDPALDKALRQTYETEKPYRVFPVHVRVQGCVGEKLTTWWTDVQKNVTVRVDSELALEAAQKRPMDTALLEEQFGRLGGTVFQLDALESHLQGDVIVPMRELNSIRRQAVELLAGERPKPPVYVKRAIEVYGDATRRGVAPQRAGEAELTALCRSLPQVQAALEAGVRNIYADFEFIKQFPAAVDAVRAAGASIALATPRIHMPGENGYHANILRLQPDAVLVRNTGALYYYLRRRQEQPDAMHPRLIGDFSLNIANHKAVDLFLEAGCDIVTPSYDLNIQQMVDLLEHSDTSRMEVVIHQHLPMFHTEHCVYCTFMSEGTDYTNCGRPCEEHRASLQDRIGMSHPVRVDEGCRNTVYNAVEQSGAEYLNNFRDLGVSSYRVEFLEETPEQVAEVISLYSRALRGEISGTQVWKSLKATNQLGVTRGQLVNAK